VLYYDTEAQRQFAKERIADLAQEARRPPASRADDDAACRSSFVTELKLQARRFREHALSRAPAFRA